MTETVWIALFAMVATVSGTLIGTLIAPWVIGRMHHAAKAAERAEDFARQDEVARRLENAQREVLGVAKRTHALVNNSFTEALRAQLAVHQQVLLFQQADRSEDLEPSVVEKTEIEIERLKRIIAERDEIAETATAMAAREIDTQADLVVATEKVAAETKRIADAAEGNEK